MKTDTSMNLMLVLFCIVLIAFVVFNGKMADSLIEKQAKLEQKVEAR